VPKFTARARTKVAALEPNERKALLRALRALCEVERLPRDEDLAVIKAPSASVAYSHRVVFGEVRNLWIRYTFDELHVIVLYVTDQPPAPPIFG
jgi:hypothetical protein